MDFRSTIIENDQNITVEDVISMYKPNPYYTIDEISNLSDQYCGYYAYLLQQSNMGAQSFKNDQAFDDKLSLIKIPLQKRTADIRDIKITKEDIDWSAYQMEGLKDWSCNYSLFFRTEGFPIILRNGFLSKCLQDAGIKDWSELLVCNATCISADLVGNIAFVEFTK